MHHRQSRTTLLNLCLVNRFLCQIARPLLYHDAPFDLGSKRNTKEVNLKMLCLKKTLSEEVEFARFVKQVTVSLGKNTDHWENFFSLLPMLVNLKSIVVRDGASWDEEDEEDWEVSNFCGRLAKEPIVIKSLEFIHRKIDTFSWITLANSFPHLETLAGAFTLKPLEYYSSPECDPFDDLGWRRNKPKQVPTFHLRCMNFTYSTTQVIFDQVLSTSFDSLTSLSLQISHQSKLTDISACRNLRSLYFILSDEQRVEDWSRRVPALQHSQAVQNLETLLSTTQSLSIRHIEITSYEEPMSYSRHSDETLSTLPSSLQSLVVFSQFLIKGRWLSMFPIDGTRPLPQLKHVLLLPPHDKAFDYIIKNPKDSPSSVCHFIPTCERLGIRCEMNWEEW